ncbi:MAG: hypothetical protein A2086_08950 [Spirochaetes bacterium GWD1_27_9]|nr:MAG: hypothetical protein A2Z98_08540 [Spirochaetes bacterium GWB1_27_13]OHD20907.1 MAG: hypothetical protein A2Y34_11780 [Spirochaetes bacterium GWC1_27_15]OHD44707.1 MAG: hypothetical protein A2086_08950 [Spirochaetes bacterium GWD1_27_9]
MYYDLENAIVSHLANLGITNNEAKIYLFLVKNPNSNGYEISKVTGISRSLVYSSLEKLKTLGFIELVKRSSASYIAKSIDELEHSININIQNSLEELRKNIGFVTHPKEEEIFVTITNKENQFKKMTYLVKTATKYLYISAGEKELLWIKKYLFALPKTIDVHIFSFSNLDIYKDKFNVYSQNMAPEFIQSEEQLRNRWRILIIKDGEEMFLCGGDETESGAAIYTKNKMMIRFAVEHFVHDVKIFNIEKKHNISDDTHLKFQQQ